jgi:hypothetical protein
MLDFDKRAESRIHVAEMYFRRAVAGYRLIELCRYKEEAEIEGLGVR